MFVSFINETKNIRNVLFVLSYTRWHDDRRNIELFLFCFRWILETSGHRYANNSIYPTAAWTAGLALNKFILGKWLRCVAIIDHLILEAFQTRTSYVFDLSVDLFIIKLKITFLNEILDLWVWNKYIKLLE